MVNYNSHNKSENGMGMDRKPLRELQDRGSVHFIKSHGKKPVGESATWPGFCWDRTQWKPLSGIFQPI